MPSFIDEHDAEIEAVADLLTYKNVTKGKIIRWLRQFQPEHQPIAMKLLNNLRFYDAAQIHLKCKDLLSIAKLECGDRLRNVFFMGLGPAGKSGGSVLHRFRHANGMHTGTYQRMFKHTTEITTLPENFNGTLIFLDDFIGSGAQSSASLFDIISIAPTASHILLLVIAGYQSAIDEIGVETGCNVIAVDPLDDHERLFSDNNPNFAEEERLILKDYCARTGSTYPFGYLDVASLVIFNDSAPNNAPSILTNEGKTWVPLFPRV